MQRDRLWADHRDGRPVERILAVMAHPDDVDFGAAGTVRTWTDAGIEVNRQQLASDARWQASLQMWRSVVSGAVDVEVYRDTSGEDEKA